MTKVLVNRAMRFKAPDKGKNQLVNYYKASVRSLEQDIKKVINEDTNKKTVQ